MNTKDKKYTLEGVFAFILWVAAVWAATLFLMGCMTPKKAVDYLKKKELLADTCAANFPVKERIDTVYEIEYHEDSAMINELLAVNKALENKLLYLEGLPPKIDSATCQELRLMYVRDVKAFQVKIAELKALVQKQKDSILIITKTQKDSAAYKALEEKYVQLDKDKKVQEAVAAAEIKEWSDKAKRRGKTVMWLSIGLALLLIAVGFLISRSLKSIKIPFITPKK